MIEFCLAKIFMTCYRGHSVLFFLLFVFVFLFLPFYVLIFSYNSLSAIASFFYFPLGGVLMFGSILSIWNHLFQVLGNSDHGVGHADLSI